MEEVWMPVHWEVFHWKKEHSINTDWWLKNIEKLDIAFLKQIITKWFIQKILALEI